MSVYIYFLGGGEAGGWGHWAVGDMGCAVWECMFAVMASSVLM